MLKLIIFLIAYVTIFKTCTYTNIKVSAQQIIKNKKLSSLEINESSYNRHLQYTDGD